MKDTESEQAPNDDITPRTHLVAARAILVFALAMAFAACFFVTGNVAVAALIWAGVLIGSAIIAHVLWRLVAGYWPPLWPF